MKKLSKHHEITGYKANRIKRDLDSNDILKKLPKNIPRKVDWREKGIISPVFNQGACGACWAYSTIETIEAMVALKTNRPVEKLSVQQIVDCATEGNYGCDGGDTCAALVWMADNNVKITTDQEYPMKDSAGFCKMSNFKSGIQIMNNFTCDK